MNDEHLTLPDTSSQSRRLKRKGSWNPSWVGCHIPIPKNRPQDYIWNHHFLGLEITHLFSGAQLRAKKRFREAWILLGFTVFAKVRKVVFTGSTAIGSKAGGRGEGVGCGEFCRHENDGTRCSQCMDYLPTWKVKNGHIQGETLLNIPYMEHLGLGCELICQSRGCYGNVILWNP